MINRMLSLKYFYSYLNEKQLIQWIVLLLLCPFAVKFHLLFSIMFNELAEYFLTVANLNYYVDKHKLIYIAMSYFLLSALLCFFIMRHKIMLPLWVLLGFIFGGSAVFYALVIAIAHNVFREGKGVLFWRARNSSDKTMYFYVLLSILLAGVMMGSII